MGQRGQGHGPTGGAWLQKAGMPPPLCSSEHGHGRFKCPMTSLYILLFLFVFTLVSRCRCRDAFFSLMKDASSLMRSLPRQAMESLSQVRV